MILKRFYDEGLAQASYLVGCSAAGEAIVIDPNRDVEQYIAAAAAEGLEIVAVTETHIHADFVSGSRELAARAGAKLYLSDEGDADWKYAFEREPNVVLIKHGDVISIGNVRLEAMHTPGHTPEHLSFMLTDTAATDQPMGVFTGDFVFVGDVGRPDLLEKAVKVAGSAERAARVLFQSLQTFKSLSDHLQIWPGHGAGSACGKGIGAVPQSTIGYERIANWAFAYDDESAFVSAVLAGQPEPPRYFAEMKRINKAGPAKLGGFHRPQRLAGHRLSALLEAGALVIDTRHAADYAVGSIPGTINIPLNNSFVTWAGWLVPYDADFYLIVGDHCPDCVERAARDLSMIGLDRLAGYFGSDAIEGWPNGERSLNMIDYVSARDLETLKEAGKVTVVDVRGQTEWDAGHIPGAIHVPLGDLTDRLDLIPDDRPVVAYCQSGARSAIAASLLEAKGKQPAYNLRGGYTEWAAVGNPIERPARKTLSVV